MGQRTMDEPPIKARPGAEADNAPEQLDAEAPDLATHLRLAADSAAAAF